MPKPKLYHQNLKTILQDCRPCGTCCKQYTKVVLQDSEVAFINKMGGHVGVSATLQQLRKKPLTELLEDNRTLGKSYMIHPDDQGLFLERRNGLDLGKIYNYRPLSCRGFRCKMAANTFLDLFANDVTCLLGLDSSCLALAKEQQ